LIKTLLAAEQESELRELLVVASRLNPASTSAVLPESMLESPALRGVPLSSVVPLPAPNGRPLAQLVGVIHRAVEQLGALVVIAPSNKTWRELMSRVAQRMRAGCITDCTRLALEDGRITAERPSLGGAFLEKLEVNKLPVLLTCQLRGVEEQWPEREVKPEVLRIEVASKEEGTLRILSRERFAKSGVDLARARRIVAVGRGFRRMEDLRMAEELARLLEAEIACSRPIASDLKWLPEDRHIGLSGRWVSPDLYIAIGISGQVQHMVGVRNSKIIVAVNNDPSAPIHREADYSVIQDLYVFLPELVKVINERRGRPT
jgi:electron transfer flavoprotein alpha subunit